MPEGEVLTDPEIIHEKLGHAVDLVIDSGILPPELSTVVSLVNDTPEIIREGKGDPNVF
jgi:tRNA A37 threonylcarbamoyladenosine synthetase subunit TsaC/SUA5/YrdC